MITDNVPDPLPPHRQHALLASLLSNAGFKEWFLPELQRMARKLELELCKDLPEKATTEKRGQHALLSNLFTHARDQEAVLRQVAEAEARPAVRNPGLV